MDKYAKVERLLYNYKMLKISIENIEEDIKLIEDDSGVKGISYDGIATSKTNKTSDIVADTVLSKTEKIHYLSRIIEHNKRDIESINKALEGLTEVEKIIVVEKYINSKQWWEVASIVRYNDRWCRKIRTDAINKLIVGIYGETKPQ